MKKIIFLTLSLILLMSIFVSANQIILQPDESSAKDVYIRKDDSTKCFGTSKNLDSGQFWKNSAHRTLLQFDLSSIPQGADIYSAELVLWMYNDGPGKNVQLNLHRITTPWIEGTTGYKNNGATWNTYDGVNNWNTPGGDFDSEIESFNIVNLQNQYYSWDVTDLVKKWYDRTYENYGMILKGDDETSDIQMRKRFRSSKYDIISQRPQLVVNYNLGPVCTDSDNGLDFFLAGTTCLDNVCENDFCTSDPLEKELTEYYCLNNSIQSIFHVCDGTCLLGACFTPCVPKTCNDLGKQCGTWDDGCGDQLECGTCSEGFECRQGICTEIPTGPATWHIQYNPTPTSPAADVSYWNLDLFDVNSQTINNLKNSGVYVMCYFSAGSWEDWRSDQDQFPESCKGSNNGWPGEKWINTNCPEVRDIMKARIDLGISKGCDGFDPDNMDAYGNGGGGFGLTETDAIDYYNFLADYAHSKGAQIGLKNALEIINNVLPNMDWAVNEQCFQYSECNYLNQVINDNKPVFQIEYGGESKADQVCDQANILGFSTLIKNMNLNEFEISCLEWSNQTQPPQDYLAYDGFENSWDGGYGWLSEWWHQGDSRIKTNNAPYEGTSHLRLRKSNGYADRQVDLSQQSNATLSFYAKIKSFEKNDFAEVLVSPDGQTWDILMTFTPADSDNTYHYYEFDLTPYGLTTSFTIAFDAEMSGTGDHLYIDEIKIF